MKVVENIRGATCNSDAFFKVTIIYNKIFIKCSDQSQDKMDQIMRQSQPRVNLKPVYLPSGLFVTYFTMLAVARTK